MANLLVGSEVANDCIGSKGGSDGIWGLDLISALVSALVSVAVSAAVSNINSAVVSNIDSVDDRNVEGIIEGT